MHLVGSQGVFLPLQPSRLLVPRGCIQGLPIDVIALWKGRVGYPEGTRLPLGIWPPHTGQEMTSFWPSPALIMGELTENVAARQESV